MAWPLASTLLALSACNALTGVSELSTCPACGDLTELDASVAADGAKLPEASAGDSAFADARDSATKVDASSDAADAADAAPPLGCDGAVACIRVVFASSQVYTGNLGGIAGADAKCQALADASPVARIKGRPFVAWVSTSLSSVSARLVHGSLPYIRPDGANIANNFNDLIDNTLQNGIAVDELGVNHGGGAVWTATGSNNGLFTGDACMDWTSGTPGVRGDRGNLGGNGSGWSVGSSDDCATPDNLYCFEK